MAVRRFLVLSISALFVALAGIGLAACGDDDDNSGSSSSGGSSGGGNGASPVFSPRNADALAHAAVIEEIPAKGWELAGEDDFSDDDTLPSTTACKAYQKTKDAQDKITSEKRAARASRKFVYTEQSERIAPQVEIEVAIFDDTASPATILKSTQSAKDNFAKCLGDVFKQSVEESGAKNVTVSTPGVTASPQRNGLGVAMESKLTDTDGSKITYRIEGYLWTYSNAGISVLFSGDPRDLTKTFMNNVMKAVEQQVEAAGK